MAGLLELFTRYVDEFGSDPFVDAADRARAEAPATTRGRRAAEHRAAQNERMRDVLGLDGPVGGGGR